MTKGQIKQNLEEIGKLGRDEPTTRTDELIKLLTEESLL